MFHRGQALRRKLEGKVPKNLRKGKKKLRSKERRKAENNAISLRRNHGDTLAIVEKRTDIELIGSFPTQGVKGLSLLACSRHGCRYRVFDQPRGRCDRSLAYAKIEDRELILALSDEAGPLASVAEHRHVAWHAFRRNHRISEVEIWPPHRLPSLCSREFFKLFSNLRPRRSRRRR